MPVPPIGSIAVYTNNVGKHSTPVALLEVTLSKGSNTSLPWQPSGRPFTFGTVDRYSSINHIKLEELQAGTSGLTTEVITYTDSIIECSNCLHINPAELQDF